MTGKACDGKGTSDTVTCTACKAKCFFGQYLSHICDGTGSTNNECKACTVSCGPGRYKSGVCDGTTDYDSVVCQDCTSSCKANEYMVGSCDGKGTKDEVECRTCKICGDGQYKSGSCLGSKDTTQCHSCSDCKMNILTKKYPQIDGVDCINFREYERVCKPSTNLGSANAATRASGQYSTVLGGEKNTASGRLATIGGGYGNLVDAQACTIGGGKENLCGGEFGTIG